MNEPYFSPASSSVQGNVLLLSRIQGIVRAEEYWDIIQGGDGNMEPIDFMAMRRMVMAEDQVLAGQRQAEAQARARAVAKWLKEKYGVDEVYLFGSLAWGGFNSHSDIDLLVRGFKDKEHYWQMQVQAENIAGPFELNLLCEEEVPESLRRKVEAKGVRLV